MSFCYIVICDTKDCYCQQSILTPENKIRNDGGGVFVEDLASIGWVEDEDGNHTCPFCSSTCDGRGEG